MVENNSDFLKLKLQSIPAADIAVKSPIISTEFNKDIAVLLCMLIFENLLLSFQQILTQKVVKKIPKNTINAHFKKSFEYTKFLRHVFESFFDWFFAPFYANKTLYKLVLCVPALDIVSVSIILLKIGEMLKEFVGSPTCCCCPVVAAVASGAAWQIECEQVPQ